MAERMTYSAHVHSGAINTNSFSALIYVSFGVILIRNLPTGGHTSQIVFNLVRGTVLLPNREVLRTNRLYIAKKER